MSILHSKYYKKYFPLISVIEVKTIANEDKDGIRSQVLKYRDEMNEDNRKIPACDIEAHLALNTIIEKIGSGETLNLYELYLLNDVLYRFKYIAPISALTHPSLAAISLKKKSRYFPPELLDKWHLDSSVHAKGKAHSGKMIVYGYTGYGKSFVTISNILREREKAVLISANGDAAMELKCMNLEGIDINVVEPEEFTLYDKVAIPKTGIPSSKMEAFFDDMLDKIESNGFANDKTRTIIFTGFHEGHYNNGFVERLTKWKCQVVIEYMGGAKWVEEHEIQDIMKSEEWEKYPIYNSLRPESSKTVLGLHFISGSGAKDFCDGLLSVGKSNITIEPRRLFGEDGFLIEVCHYVAMTADEQVAFYNKFMEMINNLDSHVKLRDL